MTDPTSHGPAGHDPNLVERASQSADQALEATRRAADAAIDSMVGRVHDLRDQASPVMDRIASPFDAVKHYARETPLKALLVSAATGAGLMALFAMFKRSRR